MGTAEEVRGIIADTVRILSEQLTDDTTLKSLGVDSLDMTEMTCELEAWFEICIPDGGITEHTTVGQIIALCQSIKEKK